MSTLRYDMLILAAVIAGAVIAGIYLFMLAVPRNDYEHLHDSVSEPDHVKLHFLRSIARLRKRLSRWRPS